MEVNYIHISTYIHIIIYIHTFFPPHSFLLGILEWVYDGGVACVGKVVVLVQRPRGSAERAGWGFGLCFANRLGGKSGHRVRAWPGGM